MNHSLIIDFKKFLINFIAIIIKIIIVQLSVKILTLIFR